MCCPSFIATPLSLPSDATILCSDSSSPSLRGPWRSLTSSASTPPRIDVAAEICGTDRDCRLRAYRAASIDIVLFGAVTDDTIEYELYQTWTPARLETGDIAIGRGESVVGLEHATRRAFHVVLKHGGLLD